MQITQRTRRQPIAPLPSRRKLVAVVLLLAFVMPQLPLAQAQGITELGTLGGTYSSATAVSADGAVVVGAADMAGNTARHAFRWTSAGMADLGTLGGTYSSANAVSADGTVVVGTSYTAGDVAYHAFRWSRAGMADLGTFGGTTSFANAASSNGAVVVGAAYTAGDAALRAFRWTSAGMVDLGTLGGTASYATAMSNDGAVVVGAADTAGNTARHAFRWTSAGMADLGTLGGTTSSANAVSANGAVVVGGANIVGDAGYHAFRWTMAGMTDLGTLGGSSSNTFAVSADGAVVVGSSYTAGDAEYHAYRWSSAGMSDLGTLGAGNSIAVAVSADGGVVVGTAYTIGSNAFRAFRWSSSAGMQSVEDWLRGAGVTVAGDITSSAAAVSSDGSVVAGELDNGRAFIARVSSIGSGLITLADLQAGLAGTATGGSTALASTNLLINGAHSHPLSHRVAASQNTFWLAGDWGRDDHGSRDGHLGLAEVGVGRNFGPAQLNLAVGQTWANQNLALNGSAQTDGSYLQVEALIPIAGTLWATLGGYGHWGTANLKRGYGNAGSPDASTASPDVNSRGLRARLDWENAWRFAKINFAPYADLSYAESKLDAYTETGGGFPARFNSRKEKVTELRIGLNAASALDNGMRLLGTLEAAHRFEPSGARTSGEVIGLFGFNLDGHKNQRNWLRAGAGVEGKLADGMASLWLNATTKGETPSAWLAASWQKAF